MADVPVSPVASGEGDPGQCQQYKPCIVMEDDGVHCQQVSSLSPEFSTKMIMQKITRNTLQHERRLFVL
jgi:hypothetical protein